MWVNWPQPTLVTLLANAALSGPWLGLGFADRFWPTMTNKRAAIGLSLTMQLATVSGDGLAFLLGWALKKP